MPQKRIYRLLNPFLLWRLRHVSERVYVVWLAALVGVLAGLAAVVLKIAIHWQQHRLAAAVTEPNRVFALSIYPVIGIALTVLPGPLTIPPVLLGLWIWSTEFAWAARFFATFRKKASDAWAHAKQHPVSSLAITVGGLAAAGIAFWAVGHYRLVDQAKAALGL